MCFEVRERNLLARIGRLKTKSGVVETPALLPVVNPAIKLVPPKELYERFRCRALITNAYILLKRFGWEASNSGVHRILGFKGVVMTDSGAYQILQYGDVDIEPDEIIRFQEAVGTDIAVILDVPTGWGGRRHAEYTVKETLRRAERLWSLKSRDDILWVGPIQGGRHLDLVALSARRISEMPFQIHALGSPTEVMERYQYPLLVDMVMTAKQNIPLSRPLHLFGAGHPHTFALAVAMGCDLFDSASYAIYARDERYMTPHGTLRLERIQHFPCNCPECSRRSPEDVKALPREERVAFLARHNLYVCLSEVRRVKQMIVEGRLWEYLLGVAHAHPSLWQAVRRLAKYWRFIERQDQLSRRSAFVYGVGVELFKPEGVSYRARLLGRYRPPREARLLVLMPPPHGRPMHLSREYKALLELFGESLGREKRAVHLAVYLAPFGAVPMELSGVYPISQHETAEPNLEVIRKTAEQTARYIQVMGYKAVVHVKTQNKLSLTVSKACREACKEGNIIYEELPLEKPWSPESRPIVAARVAEVLSLLKKGLQPRRRGESLKSHE